MALATIKYRMRLIALILVGIISMGQVFSRCAGEELSVFPRTETLRQNPLIVLTGYASSRNIVNALNKSILFTLKQRGIRLNSMLKAFTKECCP